MDNTICVEKQTKANRNLNLMFDSEYLKALQSWTFTGDYTN